MAFERELSFSQRGFDEFHPLTAVSPIDGRYAQETKQLREYSSELGLMATRTEIEARYLIALCDEGVVTGRTLTPEERVRLEGMGPSLTLKDGERIKEIEASPGGTDHDVASVILWMKEKFAGTSLEDLSEMVHFGLTSEDIDNLALRLNIQRATENNYLPLAKRVAEDMFNKADQYKELPIMGRTHGQDALPVTFGHEFAVFGSRVAGEIDKMKKHKLTGKLNGAVGLHSAHTATKPDVDWLAFSQKFVESLGLEYNPASTQTNPYEDVIERIQIVQRINGVVHDMDQDMWRYISDDWLAQEVIKGAIGSSTMSQKVNPIRFENSEAHAELSSGNVTIFADRLPESRLQRDLSDSALRRYIIPNVYATAAISYTNALRGLRTVYPDTDAIGEALDSNWAVMSEWAQQRLRVAGVDGAYNILKDRVRGVKITSRDQWKVVIDSLPIKDVLKDEIMGQSPRTYIGKAVPITERIITEGRAKIAA
ncbi:MAG TPA: adenylosuccinate lyase [Patescibacteria group bacterium]|nr:adenylosuccinate lyase [Patescibacteria group bacterium]